MMEQVRVIIPEEHFSIVEFRQDDLPGVAVVNAALGDFQSKVVFRWHLSVWLHLDDLIENGMPSIRQREVIDPWGDHLDKAIKGANEVKPNGLFLARITWNASRELIYRVYDPEPVNTFLQQIISQKKHPVAFDFRMDDDPEWKLASWHLDAVASNHGN